MMTVATKFSNAGPRYFRVIVKGALTNGDIIRFPGDGSRGEMHFHYPLDPKQDRWCGYALWGLSEMTPDFVVEVQPDEVPPYAI
jgi:hypothetical protein